MGQDTDRSSGQRYFESKLPPSDQTLRTGVRRSVRIVRDRGWVPHIFADSASDLFFGQGFAMAQDRLWQMDYLRRRALGRLAEVMGPGWVASDRQNRILGFSRQAATEVSAASPDAAEAVEAFAAGVNAWIASLSHDKLPVEFDILGYEPDPWTPRDSFVVLRGWHWHLTGRLNNLAAGEAALRYLCDDALDFLRTEFPYETIMVAAQTPEVGDRAPVGATGGGDGDGGSNNWAVAPTRTLSGHAMLATDPHLPYSLPCGLYECHLRGGGYDVAGAGQPGVPGIKFGHNGRIAWGITNLVASARDLYIETVHPEDPRLYLDGTDWAWFETRTEQIDVRDGAPVELEIRSTKRGPLVDELVPTIDDTDGVQHLSLRWVGQEVLDDVQAELDVDRAHDWQSFRKALSGWRLPIFNFVYADADGHIGWQAAGSVPIRGSGDTRRGFRPANDAAHEWGGYIDFDDLPRMLDPDRGWIATANNDPVGADFPAPLYGWWAPGQRAVRLRQFFEGRDQFTRADFRDLQFDAYSVRAELIVPSLQRSVLSHGGADGLRFNQLLTGWDFQYRPESVSASVFETFFELWVERVVRARFPAVAESFLLELGAGSGLAMRLITDAQPRGWFTESTVEQQVAATASAALADLAARFGEDESRWRWGDVHRVSFRHPLHGTSAPRELVATPPREAHGTSHTLNNNGYAHGQRFDVVSGPEFRMVVDFADLDATETILTTGQSGQPGSRHFDDMLEPWRTGTYFRLPFTTPAIEADAIGATVLEPRR